MKPRPPRCPRCNSYFAQVHPDDQEGYALPAQLCRCAVLALHEQLAAEGWSKLDGDGLTMVRKAGVPTIHRVGAFHSHGEAPFITFSRWVPAWVTPILESFSLAEAMKSACLRRCVAVPERAAAALAVQRLSGNGAMVLFLINDLAPRDAAPEDAPTHVEPIPDDTVF